MIAHSGRPVASPHRAIEPIVQTLVRTLRCPYSVHYTHRYGFTGSVCGFPGTRFLGLAERVFRIPPIYYQLYPESAHIRYPRIGHRLSSIS